MDRDCARALANLGPVAPRGVHPGRTAQSWCYVANSSFSTGPSLCEDWTNFVRKARPNWHLGRIELSKYRNWFLWQVAYWVFFHLYTFPLCSPDVCPMKAMKVSDIFNTSHHLFDKVRVNYPSISSEWGIIRVFLMDLSLIFHQSLS